MGGSWWGTGGRKFVADAKSIFAILMFSSQISAHGSEKMFVNSLIIPKDFVLIFYITALGYMLGPICQQSRKNST